MSTKSKHIKIEGKKIIPKAQVAYFAIGNVEKLVNFLERNGIKAKISNYAGSFVCNHLYLAFCAWSVLVYRIFFTR